MERDPDTVDIWLGRFHSAAAVEAYFQEQFEHDEKPLSPFVDDQGESFVDYDFMEREHYERPLTDLAAALSGHSFSSSYTGHALAAFAQASAEFDTVVLVWGGQIQRPVSVTIGRGYLNYLGRFASDPEAACLASPTP
jgi:hypothetical protein